MTNYEINVIEIIDGNTFGTTKGKIRLAGVDTPQESEYGYEAAKSALSNLIADRDVQVTEKTREGEFIIAEVFVKEFVRIVLRGTPDMLNVNNEMQKYSK